MTMDARRIAGSLVFAAAAFASIATSAPVPNWQLETAEGLEPTTLAGGTSTGFGITAEARGPRGGHEGGEVEASLVITGNVENLEAASVDLALISESDPTQREEQHVVVLPGMLVTAGLLLPAWQTCEAGPCFDDYRLEITNATAIATVVVEGSIRAVLHGRDQNPEIDSQVLLQITPLGAP